MDQLEKKLSHEVARKEENDRAAKSANMKSKYVVHSSQITFSDYPAQISFFRKRLTTNNFANPIIGINCVMKFNWMNL